MGIGFTELLILGFILALLFGAGKLPALMGDAAKGIRTFKAGLKDDETPAAPADRATQA